MFLEKKAVLGCVWGKGQGSVNLCVASVFCSLKGLIFFLADEHKAALCTSVISLPGLAVKLANAAHSVELALSRECHTEKAVFPATENWLCHRETMCVDDCMLFYLPCVKICRSCKDKQCGQHTQLCLNPISEPILQFSDCVWLFFLIYHKFYVVYLF